MKKLNEINCLVVKLNHLIVQLGYGIMEHETNLFRKKIENQRLTKVFCAKIKVDNLWICNDFLFPTLWRSYVFATPWLSNKKARMP